MIDKEMMIVTLAVNKFLEKNGIDLESVEDIEIDYTGFEDKTTITIGDIEFYLMEDESYILENRYNAKINGLVYQELGFIETNGYRFVAFTEMKAGA